MIANTEIRDKNIVGFYDDYILSDEDLTWFIEMAENGEAETALDLFIKESIIPPGVKYSDFLRQYLNDSESGILSLKDRNKAIRNIAILSVGLGTLWNRLYKTYLKEVYSPDIFIIAGVANDQIRKIILSESIGIFEKAINGAMSQTSSFVINGIRTLQREMIVENFKLRTTGLTGKLLDDEVIKFKRAIRSKYPQLYKAMSEGNILVTSKFSVGGETFRHYKIDTYADMAVRTTLLNVDRASNLMMAMANDEPVVEYILADQRTVKKDREICQDILGNFVLGKSLLAIDKETASKLNIMTIEEAETSPDYAMGVGCRHTIRRLGKAFLNEVDKIIKGE